MACKQDLDRAQARVSTGGATWIALNLRDTVMFWIRSGGRVKELVVYPKQDRKEFPLEWFRAFHVILWLTDGTAIACDVNAVTEIKRRWFFLGLKPSSDRDQELWTALGEANVSRIELVANEEHLLFVWQEDLRLFKRQEVH